MTTGLTSDRRGAVALTAAVAMLPLVPEARAAVAKATAVAPSPTRGLRLNDDWLFLRGEGDFSSPATSDGTWRKLDLPHDWSVEDLPPAATAGQVVGPFDRKAIGSNATGFTVGGEGWYRKHFRVDSYPADARIMITFEGVYLESEVFLNGRSLGSNVFGYAPFSFDMTPLLDRAGDNVIAVRVRNTGRNTRWYAGSGLHRPVTLDVLPATCNIARGGIFAHTARLSGGRAQVSVATALEGELKGCRLVTRLVDGDGKVAAEAITSAAASMAQVLSVRAPRLWSPDAPYLYTLTSELQRDGVTVDSMVQNFGVRIVAFDPKRGMSINGKATRVRGGCVHHDNGLLGACAFADADDRRIRLLKARGFNAIRSAHNPTSRSLRDACDRLGMLLIEEAFDAWHVHKEPQDFATHFPEQWQAVISAMVLEARNSPSVIMWSIGNEIPSRSTDEGLAYAWKLTNAVKQLDQTRPITAGLNGVLGQEVVADAKTALPGRGGKTDNASTVFLNLPGYNYRLDDIEPEHATHPERVVYASETFPREVFDYATLSDRAPYFLGEFVWTAMDYIGEAGIGATAFLKKGNPPFYLAGWPWVNAWCGDIDLIGQQKAASLARDVAWGLSPVELVVQRPAPEGTYAWVSAWGWPDELASWTWPDHADKELVARIFTLGDRVELKLNGRTVAEKALTAADKGIASLPLRYAPGSLEAVASKNGKVIGRRTLQTVGPAVALRITVEPASGQTGRDALAYVRIDTVDAAGLVLPEDQREVAVEIAGPAELAALGSADPLATGSLRGPQTRTFRGRAQAILRARGQGDVVITARTPGLPGTSAKLRFS